MLVTRCLSAAARIVRSPAWLSVVPGTSAAAHVSSLHGDESTDSQEDNYYWIPHATITPASIAQRRATGRVEAAIESVLLADGVIREQLVNRYGLNVHRVQVSKDRRSIFILWDANTGKVRDCEQALQKSAFRLRRDLAKILQSKHTPYLEFRHNHLPPYKAAAATAMQEVEKELSAEAAAAASADAEDVNAAIARLEQLTQAKQQ